MNKKQKMSIEKGKIARIILGFFLYLIVLLVISSCRSSEANKWAPPKFVKEWEIKEIKPGLPHQIISITVNKNGVFALVKAEEVKYSSPKAVKKVTEMTKDDKEKFIINIIIGRLYSVTVVNNMSDKEKDELIDFLIKYFILPRNASEMTEKEKDTIVEFLLRYEDKESERNKNTFKDILRKEGKDKFIDRIAENIRTAIREEVTHFRIQEYDFEGNFVKEWPQEKTVFKKPIIILSDSLGNLYTADYASNEMMRFAVDGTIKGRWKMLSSSQTGEGFHFRGVAIGKNDDLLIIGEGDWFLTPKLFQYNTNGKLIRAVELNSKIEIYFKLFKSYIFPEEKIRRINDMVIDSKGEIFLLGYEDIVNEPVLIKLTSKWKQERRVKVILKEGFEISKIERMQKNLKGLADLGKFDSTQLSWIENGPGFYFPSSVFVDGKYVYVSFLGSKSFGVIDAVIYNTKGKMIGYWKRENRSNMAWYKELNPDIEVSDINLSMAHYGSAIYVARTMHIRTGAFYEKNIIQKFDKEGET